MGYKFQMTAADQSLLNAHFEIDGASIILHSRGGTKSKAPLNTDYSAALRLILERLAEAGIEIQAAWVDSSRVQNIPMADRLIFDYQDVGATPEEAFHLMNKRMKAVGRAPTTAGGNQTKRIRIQLHETVSSDKIAHVLQGVPAKKDLRALDRLPAEELKKVTAEHVWIAIQRLQSGYTDHGFGPSTDYDLIGPGGSRLPPKAVFGLAATEALGFKVLPKHFAAGPSTPCFRVLAESGFKVVPKGDQPTSELIPPEPNDQEWAEGSPKWVAHFKRERAAGLSHAKKAEFRRVHGKLFCERCEMDPVEEYGAKEAEACIEVHHQSVQVKDMSDEHLTKLDDLQCLCANCHRLVHRLQMFKQ